MGGVARCLRPLATLMLAPVWLLVILGFGIPNPIGPIIDYVTGTVKGVSAEIQKWVTTFVKAAIGVVVDVIENAYDSLHQAIVAIRNGLRGVRDVLESVWAAIKHVTDVVIGNVVKWFTAIIQGVKDTLTGLINSVADFLGAAINGVAQRVAGVFDWVVKNVWDPLWSKIVGAINWVRDTVIPFLKGLVDRALDYAHGIWDWIGDHVMGVVNFVNNTVKGMVNVLNKAWEWIVFMATHPFTWWLKLFDYFSDRSASYLLGKVVSMFQREGDSLERWVKRWLGL